MDSQRFVEFVVQLLAIIASAGAFVAALFTEIKVRDLNSVEMNSIQTASDFLDQNELFLRTEAMAGIVFAITGISVVVGLIASIGRICHARHTLSTYRIFSCLYLLFALVCFLGFAAAGILGVFTAMDWFELLSNSGSRDNVVEDLRNSVTATAACSLFAAAMYGLLEVVILFCCSATKHY